MRTLFVLTTACLAVCIGCGQRRQDRSTSADVAQTRVEAQCDTLQSGNESGDQEEADYCEESEEVLDGNAARFHNWTDADWYDNDYFRILRAFFDAYVRGEIEERDELMPLIPLMKGKFVIYHAETCIAGGLFISFVFLESPNDIYDVWVYSYVENGEVYIDLSSVRSIRKSGRESGLSKEDIYRRIKAYPENKLW